LDLSYALIDCGTIANSAPLNCAPRGGVASAGFLIPLPIHLRNCEKAQSQFGNLIRLACIRGLEEMKKAMWSVDRTGNFRFSDKDNPDQLKLLDESCSQSWLAEELHGRLKGREMTAAGVKEFVLTDTPCYLFKEALKILQSDKPERIRVVKAPIGRRRGEYKDEDLDEIIVKFDSTNLF
jgi:hypothetical protein